MPDAPVAPLSRPGSPNRLTPGSANAETERLLLEALALDAQASDPAASRAALAAYEAVLAREPSLDAIALDEARPSWPTVLAIELAMARLSLHGGEPERCLARYEAILAAHPRGDGVEEAVHGAAVCAGSLQPSGRIRSAPHPPIVRSGRRGRRGRREVELDPSFDPRPLTAHDITATAALHRFTCRAPQHPWAITARYRHARILYEANQFDEAAALFRSIAVDHPSHELAEYAANLYLDSLNLLATRRAGRQSACLAALQRDVDPLAQLYCASETARDAHPDLCRVLQQIRCTMLRSAAERHAEAGRHAEAAQAYESFARESVATGRLLCDRLDEALYNAAVSWDAAHEPVRAMSARELLLRRSPHSAFADRTLWAVASSEHAVARYEEAAARYEELARLYPGSDESECAEVELATGRCPDAPVALTNAVLLRVGLDELDRALEDAALFERNYARSRREETVSLLGSLVIALARRERWADVVRHGDAWARRWLGSAPTELGLEVRRALARAYARQRSPRAPALWAVLADAAFGSIEGDSARTVARDVVAEARVRVTDADSDAFLARRAPRANLAAWRSARDEELRALRTRLERVAELEVPRRDVEAIARLARLEAHLARETADADLLAQATDRYATCLAHARATRTFGETSTACFDALTLLAPDRFTAAHELTAGARFVASIPARPRPATADEGDASSR